MLKLIFQLTLLTGCLYSCGSSGWKQFHADGQSQGNTGVHTASILTPKWSAPALVGDVSYASPVIDDDGNVYIGTTDGVMVAVKNNGSIKWKFPTASNIRTNLTDPIIVSAACVGMNKDIFFIASFRDPAHGGDFRSSLIHLNNDGSFANSFVLDPQPILLPRWTTCSPKLLHTGGKDFIFVTNQGLLFVFDANCQLIKQQVQLFCTGGLTGGTSIFRDYDRFTDYKGGPYIFKGWHNPEDDNYWLDPTVAIVTKVEGKELTKPIIVVATNRCGLQAFEFTPPPETALTLKWNRDGDRETFYSSPAVSGAGELIIGFGKKYLISKDVVTGKDNWIFTSPAGEPLLAASSFYAGTLHVFAVGLNDVYVIDNKLLLSTFHLPGHSLSSPGISYDRLYVSSASGMHSLSIDLSMAATDASTVSGMSSPAIGEDGTVYFVSSDGKMMAYH